MSCFCNQYYNQYPDYNQYQNFNPCCRRPNRCCCNDFPRGIPGPPGPQGPRGFTGLPGTPGLNGTLYAGVTTPTAVAVDAIVPIATIAASTNSPFTVTGGTINVPAGTYLVTYGMESAGDAAGITESSLYINGAASPTENITTYSSTTEPYTVSKTVLLNYPTAGTLALHNTGDASATYYAGYITITQLSA